MMERQGSGLEELLCILGQREMRTHTLMLSSLSYLCRVGSSAQGIVLSIITMCLPTLTNAITVILHRPGQRPISR